MQNRLFATFLPFQRFDIKRLVVFFVSLAIISSSFGQRLSGVIKQYRDDCYSVHEIYGKVKKDKKIHDSVFRSQVVLLDENGNILQVTESNSDGTEYCRYYGKKGYRDNNVESVFVRFEPRISIDRKPFLIGSVRYFSGEMCEIDYKNDEHGRPVEETLYDLMGAVSFTVSIKRDGKGNPLEYKFSDGAIDKYKYDSNGNRIEWFSKSATGKTTITSYKHDERGNVVEEIVKDFFKSSYKFHDEFNTYVYRYDKQGNWIERIDYEHDIPQRMVVRTIEY
jgi:YD repeat-containing protein